MLLESTSNSREVWLEVENIDFNYCDYGWASDFKEITIHNDYPFSIWVHWIT